MIKEVKKEEFTEGQLELLSSLAEGCNICLYRNGQVRLIDSKHNPLKNLRSDMFEKVRNYLVQEDGLFYLNPEIIKTLPQQIQKLCLQNQLQQS